MSRAVTTLAVALCCGLAACGDLPRDPNDTTQRVRGGVMFVGAAHDPPFVRVATPEPQGREADLVRAFARSQRARVVWSGAGYSSMMERLRERRLHAVIGGHADDMPWKKDIALSRPYPVRDMDGRLVRRVVALPPGENAWLMEFERFVRTPAARALLEAETSAPAGAAR